MQCVGGIWVCVGVVRAAQTCFVAHPSFKVDSPILASRALDIVYPTNCSCCCCFSFVVCLWLCLTKENNAIYTSREDTFDLTDFNHFHKSVLHFGVLVRKDVLAWCVCV